MVRVTSTKGDIRPSKKDVLLGMLSHGMKSQKNSVSVRGLHCHFVPLMLMPEMVSRSLGSWEIVNGNGARLLSQDAWCHTWWSQEPQVTHQSTFLNLGPK